MAGLVPAIHVLRAISCKDVGPPNKSGDDVVVGSYFAGNA